MEELLKIGLSIDKGFASWHQIDVIMLVIYIFLCIICKICKLDTRYHTGTLISTILYYTILALYMQMHLDSVLVQHIVFLF